MPCRIAVLLSILSLLFPRAASCQDFSSIGGDLSALERLIQDTLDNSVEQQKQLEMGPASYPYPIFKWQKGVVYIPVGFTVLPQGHIMKPCPYGRWL
jgi:hypothetical protein